MPTPADRLYPRQKDTLASSRRCLRRLQYVLLRSDARMAKTNAAINETISRQLETRDRTDPVTCRPVSASSARAMTRGR